MSKDANPNNIQVLRRVTVANQQGPKPLADSAPQIETPAGATPDRQWTAYEKRTLATVLLMAVSLPFMLYGCLLSFQNVVNSPVAWLPESSKPRQALLDFAEAFQTEDMVVVSWNDCNINDPRLPRFAEIINSRDESALEQTNLSGVVIDGFHAVERLIYDADLSRDEAVERLAGLLIGKDGKTSCALLPTRFRSRQFRNSTVDFIIAATREAGVDDGEVRLAGAFVEGVAIDHASTESFKAFVLPSGLLIALVCWRCLKSWRLAIAVLSVAGYCGGLVIACLPALGIELNAVLVVMAPLIMVLGVSAGIHLVNYYLDEWKRDSADPVGKAMQAGWWPCTFCTITTSIGMASLTLSDIVPVRQFGALTAMMVLVSLVMLMLVLPGAMHWHRRCTPRTRQLEQPRHAWSDASRFTRAGWAPIVCAGLIIMAVGGYGVSQVQTSVSVMNLLDEDHWLVSNYRWLESELGPLVPIEILVRFDGDRLDSVQRVEVLRRIEEQLYEFESLGSVFSGATFLPYIPEEGGFQGTIERSVLRRQMPQIKQQLAAQSWLAADGDAETWRISARVPAFGNENYDELMSAIRRDASHLVAHELDGDISVELTGLAPVVSHAQNMLLNDLFRSLIAAVGLVALVLMIVFRSVRAGLLAMIPNMFPSVVLFGGMGLAGLPVDIGTVMTASVALGIAVDDTIHFLTWFRREHQQSGCRDTAIERSFQHSASAMLQTTAVCGLGLAPFVFADFVPTAQFAWMMIALLGLAIVGDLILLPALLAAPSGKFFESANGRKNETVPDSKVETNVPTALMTDQNEGQPILVMMTGNPAPG